jgi:hypothetical protein
MGVKNNITPKSTIQFLLSVKIMLLFIFIYDLKYVTSTCSKVCDVPELEEYCWYSFPIVDVSLDDSPEPLLLLKSEK